MASALWEELRTKGLQDLAPVLIEHGVRSMEDLRRGEGVLVLAGVSPLQIDLLLGRQCEPAVLQPVRRSDLPPMPTRKRASFEASIAAARPEES